MNDANLLAALDDGDRELLDCGLAAALLARRLVSLSGRMGDQEDLVDGRAGEMFDAAEELLVAFARRVARKDGAVDGLGRLVAVHAALVG
jgi:hypothetical protein